jgi:hypothetical protein
MGIKPDQTETVPLREHLAVVREADKRFEQERDRRYSEVAIEREKALEIKNEADKAALALAREIQTYKDENADKLRAQFENERVGYPDRFRGELDKLAESITEVATKLEGQIKPLYDYINKQQGLSSGGEHASTTSRAQANYRLALIGLLVTVVIGAVGIIFALKG